VTEALDNLRKEVEEAKVVMATATAVLTEQSGVISNLAQQIRDLKDDPAEIERLAGELDSAANALSGAIPAPAPVEPAPVEPTPVEPTPEAPVEPEPEAGEGETP
jgi:hypothetical protein